MLQFLQCFRMQFCCEKLLYTVFHAIYEDCTKQMTFDQPKKINSHTNRIKSVYHTYVFDHRSDLISLPYTGLLKVSQVAPFYEQTKTNRIKSTHMRHAKLLLLI